MIINVLMRLIFSIALSIFLLPCFAQKKHKTELTGKRTMSLADIEKGKHFASLFGKLPIPIMNGQIIAEKISKPLGCGYGPIPKGVEILAGLDDNVHVVTDGIVKSIIQVDGLQVVIIQHGTYFTVYHNLKNVIVKKEMQVKANEIIGAAAILNDLPGIRFQIWKSEDKLRYTEIKSADWLSKD